MKKILILLLGAVFIISAITTCGSPSSAENATVQASAEGSAESPADADESAASVETTSQEETAVLDPAAVPSTSRDIFAMDTYMTVTCYGDRCEEALDAAEAEITRLDALLSTGSPDSEISRINAAGEGPLSEDSKVMLEESLKIYEDTQGAFDITVYPLMALWGFTDQDFQVPEEDELAEVLAAVGSDRLAYDSETLQLGKGQGIDLGGIAKGYTSDRLMGIFEEYDLVSGLVSLGGNVQLYHTKPDGSLWKVGIQDPHQADDRSSLLGVLETENCAVITSGAYERFFTDDSGNTWHHIVDPHTGYPAENGLISTTIVSKRGMLADGLSTSFYVMGLEDAIAYWKSSKEDFDMILMTDADEVYVTEDLKDAFKTDYPVHVIEK